MRYPDVKCGSPQISGLQKGPAERGHAKKRQKSSKSVKNIFDTFRQVSRRAKNFKNRQKVSKIFSTLFDNFRVAPVFRPPLGGSTVCRRTRDGNAKEHSFYTIFWGPIFLASIAGVGMAEMVFRRNVQKSRCPGPLSSYRKIKLGIEHFKRDFFYQN